MWTEWLSYWDVALALAGALAMLIGGGLGLWWIRGWQRRARQRRLSVALSNQGNVRCAYQVWVDAAPAGLGFSFLGPGAGQPAPTAVTRSAAPAARPSGAGLAPAGQNFLRLISDLSYLLPGQLGASLRTVGYQARSVELTAQHAQNALDSAAALTGAPASSSASSVSAITLAPAPEAAAFRTGPIAPGETLTLNLWVTPHGAAGPACAFEVRSRPLEVENAPVSAEPVSLTLPELGWPRRYLAPAGVALTALVGAGLCLAYVLSVFGFGL